MAVSWAEAEVDLHVDGSALPGEVRQAAREAASQGGKTFQKEFRRFMGKAALDGVRSFGRVFTRELGKIFRGSRAFRGLSRSLTILRRDFRIVGQAIRGGFGLAMDSIVDKTREVMRPLRNLRWEIGVAMARSTREFRESAAQIMPTLDDWRQTFPAVTRAVERTRNGFRAFATEVRGFGELVRTDSVKTMNDLREGASKLRISVDDLRDTFPGLARAIDSTRGRFTVIREQFARLRETARTLRPDMERLRPSFDSIGESVTRFGNRLRNLNTLWGDVRAGMKSYRESVRETSAANDEVEKSSDRAGRAKSRLSAVFGKVSGSVKNFLSNWKRLPHGFRQAVFWTGLVIAALGTLSVVSSALSGTIVSLITMVTALGAAAGIAVAGFTGLFEEGAKLTAGAEASKTAFQELGEAFNNLQTGITNAMFENMAGSIENITNTLLPALEGNINAFAANVGANIGKIFDALSSPEGIANFQALLDGFQPILDSLVDAAISFGDAFADILIASLPTAQAFAEAIADVGKRFSEWTSSEEGRERLATFFATAERIMPKIVELVSALAGALAGLVTPTTMAATETFIDSLVNFLPILSNLVEVVANLNVFGLLAAALDLVFAALQPLMPIFLELSATLGPMLVEGITALTPAFQRVGEAVAPFLELLGVLITAILPPLLIVIEDAINYIAELAETFLGAEGDSKQFKDTVKIVGDVVGNVFTVLANVVGVAMDFVSSILKAVGQLLRGDFKGAFDTVFKFVKDTLKRFGVDIDDVIKWVDDMVTEVGNFFDDMGRNIENVINDIIGFLGDLWAPIQDVINWFGSLFGAANNAKSASSSASRTSGSGGGFAAGGILTGPRRILAGEAGPEAIVPLNRALGSVDPSVRNLSAIAQGKAPGMANGGIVGGSTRTVTIAPGAVQVFDSGNSRQTAYDVLDVLANRIAG